MTLIFAERPVCLSVYSYTVSWAKYYYLRHTRFWGPLLRGPRAVVLAALPLKPALNVTSTGKKTKHIYDGNGIILSLLQEMKLMLC